MDSDVTLPTRKSNYFPALDGIRGIAALLIAIRHTPEFFGPWTFQESYLAVDLFFVLSGVVISSNYEKRILNGLSAAQFSFIRLVRIYPFYILGAVIGFSLAVLVAFQNDFETSSFYLFLAIFMIPNIGFGVPSPLLSLYPLNGPSWSLFFELFANIFYGIFIKIFVKRGLIVLLILSAMGLVLCIIAAPHHTLNIGFTSKSWPAGFFRVLYSFYAGVFIYRRFSERNLITQSFFSEIALITVIIFVGILLTAAPIGREQTYYDLILAMIIFPLIVHFSLRITPTKFTAKIMKFSGEVSYPLYALHAPAGSLVFYILTVKFGQTISSTSPVPGILFLAIFIPGCWFLSRFFDHPVRIFFNSKVKIK